MRAVLGQIAVIIVVCYAAGARAGESHPVEQLAQAQKELEEVERLGQEGKYAEALPLAEHAVQLREKALGPDHLAVAECLDALGKLHQRQGNFSQAEPLYLRALKIQEAALGKNHPDVAISLNDLASLYRAQGAYQRAEPLYLRSLQIREAVLGKNHPDVAISLNDLASLYQAQGAYQRAGPLFQRALQIQEVKLGKNHPDVATVLTNLALLYMNQGEYGRAEALYQHALQILEMASGQSQLRVAAALNNHALLYKTLGAYAQAEVLYQRALQILETVHGKGHPDIGISIDNLANLYRVQGEYGRAEPLYQRALQILEAALGKDHPDVATVLNNLALLYQDGGEYARAEPLFQRVLQIREAKLGKNHPSVAISIDNLATIYTDQGAYERAEPLLQRALKILEATLGENHPDVATSLGNLASLYYYQGAYDRAEPLFQRAFQIWEAKLGKNHPDVATVLNNLALLYADQGKYGRAEPLYQRALQITEATLGKNHPNVATVLKNLAQLNLALNRYGSVLPLFERAFAISEQRLRKEALGLSEARLADLLSLLRYEDVTLYKLLLKRPSESAVRRLALIGALLHKGRSVDELADISRTIYRSLGEADRETFQRLRALRTQLSALSYSGPGQFSPIAYQARLKDLEIQGDTLEAELAQHSAVFRAQRQLPLPADVIARAAAALPTDGALIEIIAFTAHPLVPLPGTDPSKIHITPVYFALVLLPNRDIRVADLGPTAAIDNAVARLHDALAHRDAAYLKASQELYHLVFQPIAPLLGSQRQLFLSPDGQLSLIPFAALHDGTSFLVEAYDLTYLTSGRDLLRRNTDIAPSHSVVALVDPAFDAAPSHSPTGALPVSSALEPARRSYALERLFPQNRDWMNHPWAALPGTCREAEAIRKLLPQTLILAGPDATKQALLDLTSPEILHIGTHGIFLQDPTPLPAPLTWATRKSFDPDLPGAKPQHIPPDPLLRSAIVLAGASVPAHQGDAAPSRIETSLVTALEVAGMNLWGTQLVVLSACATGQGDVKVGQGVYGLRRAFTVAGAETVVTSLWNIDDETTHPLMDLMEGYYQRLLQGQGRAHALREAMEAVRAEHPHPYYWAPFIVVGNGAPLRGFATSVPAVPRQTH